MLLHLFAQLKVEFVYLKSISKLNVQFVVLFPLQLSIFLQETKDSQQATTVYSNKPQIIGSRFRTNSMKEY